MNGRGENNEQLQLYRTVFSDVSFDVLQDILFACCASKHINWIEYCECRNDSPPLNDDSDSEDEFGDDFMPGSIESTDVANILKTTQILLGQENFCLFVDSQINHLIRNRDDHCLPWVLQKYERTERYLSACIHSFDIFAHEKHEKHDSNRKNRYLLYGIHVACEHRNELILNILDRLFPQNVRDMCLNNKLLRIASSTGHIQLLRHLASVESFTDLDIYRATKWAMIHRKHECYTWLLNEYPNQTRFWNHHTYLASPHEDMRVQEFFVMNYGDVYHTKDPLKKFMFGNGGNVTIRLQRPVSEYKCVSKKTTSFSV